MRTRGDVSITPPRLGGAGSGCESFTLPNGLHVIVREDHFASVVALQAWVKVGAADEEEPEAGVAHVHEHMLFKGTAKRGVGQIAAEVESSGGNINAFTTADHTVYHLVLAGRHFATGLDILADALRHSTFDADRARARAQGRHGGMETLGGHAGVARLHRALPPRLHRPSLRPPRHRLEEDDRGARPQARCSRSSIAGTCPTTSCWWSSAT